MMSSFESFGHTGDENPEGNSGVGAWKGDVPEALFDTGLGENQAPVAEKRKYAKLSGADREGYTNNLVDYFSADGRTDLSREEIASVLKGLSNYDLKAVFAAPWEYVGPHTSSALFAPQARMGWKKRADLIDRLAEINQDAFDSQEEAVEAYRNMTNKELTYWDGITTKNASDAARMKGQDLGISIKKSKEFGEKSWFAPVLKLATMFGGVLAAVQGHAEHLALHDALPELPEVAHDADALHNIPSVAAASDANESFSGVEHVTGDPLKDRLDQAKVDLERNQKLLRESNDRIADLNFSIKSLSSRDSTAAVRIADDAKGFSGPDSTELREHAGTMKQLINDGKKEIRGQQDSLMFEEANHKVLAARVERLQKEVAALETQISKQKTAAKTAEKAVQDSISQQNKVHPRFAENTQNKLEKAYNSAEKAYRTAMVSMERHVNSATEATAAGNDALAAAYNRLAANDATAALLASSEMTRADSAIRAPDTAAVDEALRTAEIDKSISVTKQSVKELQNGAKIVAAKTSLDSTTVVGAGKIALAKQTNANELSKSKRVGAADADAAGRVKSAQVLPERSLVEKTLSKEEVKAQERTVEAELKIADIKLKTEEKNQYTAYVNSGQFQKASDLLRLEWMREHPGKRPYWEEKTYKSQLHSHSSGGVVDEIYDLYPDEDGNHTIHRSGPGASGGNTGYQYSGQERHDYGTHTETSHTVVDSIHEGHWKTLPTEVIRLYPGIDFQALLIPDPVRDGPRVGFEEAAGFHRMEDDASMKAHFAQLRKVLDSKQGEHHKIKQRIIASIAAEDARTRDPSDTTTRDYHFFEARVYAMLNEIDKVAEDDQAENHIKTILNKYGLTVRHSEELFKEKGNITLLAVSNEKNDDGTVGKLVTSVRPVDANEPILAGLDGSEASAIMSLKCDNPFTLDVFNDRVLVIKEQRVDDHYKEVEKTVVVDSTHEIVKYYDRLQHDTEHEYYRNGCWNPVYFSGQVCINLSAGGWFAIPIPRPEYRQQFIQNNYYTTNVYNFYNHYCGVNPLPTHTGGGNTGGGGGHGAAPCGPGCPTSGGGADGGNGHDNPTGGNHGGGNRLVSTSNQTTDLGIQKNTGGGNQYSVVHQNPNGKQQTVAQFDGKKYQSATPNKPSPTKKDPVQQRSDKDNKPQPQSNQPAQPGRQQNKTPDSPPSRQNTSPVSNPTQTPQRTHSAIGGAVDRANADRSGGRDAAHPVGGSDGGAGHNNPSRTNTTTGNTNIPAGNNVVRSGDLHVPNNPNNQQPARQNDSRVIDSRPVANTGPGSAQDGATNHQQGRSTTKQEKTRYNAPDNPERQKFNNAPAGSTRSNNFNSAPKASAPKRVVSPGPGRRN